MAWNEVANGLFGFMGLSIAGWVAFSIDKMRASVEKLNVRVAVIIEKTEGHEKRISKLEDRSV